MKCNIAKDLIPLYAEGLCSKETAEEVREHIENCADCRKLLDDPPAQTPSKIPDEGTAMKKVNRSFRKKSLLNKILAAALGAVVITAGTLTVGQIAQVPFIPSFETILMDHMVKSRSESIANGHISTLPYDISYDYLEDTGIEGEYYDGFFMDLENADGDMLKQCYDAAYGGTKAKVTSVKTSYGDIIRGSAKAVMSNVTIAFSDGRERHFVFAKNTDNLFKVFAVDEPESEAEERFQNALTFISLRNIWISGTTAASMERDKPFNTTENIMKEIFVSDDAVDNMNKFYSSGYKVTKTVFSRPVCEVSTKRFFYNAVVTAEDGKGRAVLQTKLYFDENGIYTPDSGDMTVISDGCTPGLTEGLEHFFG